MVLKEQEYLNITEEQSSTAGTSDRAIPRKRSTSVLPASQCLLSPPQGSVAASPCIALASLSTVTLSSCQFSFLPPKIFSPSKFLFKKNHTCTIPTLLLLFTARNGASTPNYSQKSFQQFLNSKFNVLFSLICNMKKL